MTGATQSDPSHPNRDRLRRLYDSLRIEQPTGIVDIGANPIDGAPPYKIMLDAELCRVTGFEPDPGALAALNSRKSARETYLPYAVGYGSKKKLHQCRYSGWTSTLHPDPAALEVFQFFKRNAEVTGTTEIDTRRLDDMAEIERVDYLKIDIQGGELDVFRNARLKLADTSVIQTEVSLVSLYQNQPCFGDIDLELRRQGFIIHFFPSFKPCMISPLILDNDPKWALNQVVEADVVYVRDFRHPDRLTNEHLRQMALIADACYNSFDLALSCIIILEKRGAVAPQTANAYLSMINELRSQAAPG